MNGIGELFAPWLAGMGLGTFFFCGLWWTIRRALASPRPGLWFAGSSLARIGLTLAGIFWWGDGRWERILACVAGFVMARLAATRLAGPPLPAAREDDNAPQS